MPGGAVVALAGDRALGRSPAAGTLVGVACGLGLLALGLPYERRRVSPAVAAGIKVKPEQSTGQLGG